MSVRPIQWKPTRRRTTNLLAVGGGEIGPRQLGDMGGIILTSLRDSPGLRGDTRDSAESPYRGW
jgi:hypothetical protein